MYYQKEGIYNFYFDKRVGMFIIFLSDTFLIWDTKQKLGYSFNETIDRSSLEINIGMGKKWVINRIKIPI